MERNEISKKFYDCFEKGCIKFLDKSTVLVKRHPEANEEKISTGSLQHSIQSVEKSWDKLNEEASKHGAKIITKREDFYGDKTLIQFKCTQECCCHWESTYNVFYNMLKKWHKKSVSSELMTKIACPNIRKIVSGSNTQWGKFEEMTNEQLMIEARKRTVNFSKGNGDFRKENSVLSRVMDNRVENGENLLRQFSIEKGWRVARPELKHWTIDQWREYLLQRGYKSVSEWKRMDGRAYVICSSIHQKSYYEILQKEFFGTSYLFLDGERYASRAEVLVALCLKSLGMKFEYDNQWGFSREGSSRNMQYDFHFFYDEKEYHIEVWMYDPLNVTEGESKNKMIAQYLNNRKYKKEMIAKHHPSTTLIEIETRVKRDEGEYSYYEHIKSTLLHHGIKKATELDFDYLPEIEIRSKVEKWSNKDFLNECIKNEWKFITEMPSYIQNHLREYKSLQADVAKLLAEHYKYPLNTRFYLAPSKDVIEYCMARPDIQSKDNYIDSHSKGLLPHGFPQNPVHSYTNINSWGEVWGRSVTTFLDYDEAKTIVQAFQFKSSTEYEKARDSSDEKYSVLKQIYKIPDHPYTGYADWDDWASFLGYEKVWSLTEDGIRTLKRIESGSVLEVCRIIKKELNCKSKTELRRFSSKAVMALERNLMFRDIEIVAFGSTFALSNDWYELSKTVKTEHLKSMTIWRKVRAKHNTYKRFPAKFYNKIDEYNGDWNNIIRFLRRIKQEL